MENLEKYDEQILALDLLHSAKSGITSYAAVLAETETPHVRNVLKTQLDDTIHLHEKITNYMMEKGFCDAHNLSEQINIDFARAEKTLNLS